MSTTVKYHSFEYDFTKSGGAQRNYKTGIFLPIGGMVMGSYVEPINDFTSAGAAIISVSLPTRAAAILQAPFDEFNTEGLLTAGIIVPNVNQFPLPNLSEEIILNISGADLTGGKMNIVIMAVTTASPSQAS